MKRLEVDRIEILEHTLRIGFFLIEKMMLIDSNIIIYAAKPEHSALRGLIAEHSPAVSAISYVEVRGYNQLTEQERSYFEECFNAAKVLPVSQEVLNQAVKLRQSRKMSLGDSLVAATAIVYKFTLVH